MVLFLWIICGFLFIPGQVHQAPGQPVHEEALPNHGGQLDQCGHVLQRPHPQYCQPRRLPSPQHGSGRGHRNTRLHVLHVRHRPVSRYSKLQRQIKECAAAVTVPFLGMVAAPS